MEKIVGLKQWLPLMIFQSKLGTRLHLREKHDVRQTRVKEGYELVILRLSFPFFLLKFTFK